MITETVKLYGDREREPVALKFATMGYHAFVLRYSTYDERGQTKPVSVMRISLFSSSVLS